MRSSNVSIVPAATVLSSPHKLIIGIDAFQEFLTGFKTSPEQTITTALGNITIGEDDLDDEYDLMEEDGQDANRQQAKERRAPQYKYKNMLQQLSDRTIDEATIDLDDLATV
jgi:DNA replication licensing factor MCM7